jgi:hypothetical protein
MRSRVALSFLAFATCHCGKRLEIPDPHFDPPSATTLPEVNSLVKVINLDDEPVICVTTDGATARGFDLHAGVTVRAGDREGLERWCREGARQNPPCSSWMPCNSGRVPIQVAF